MLSPKFDATSKVAPVHMHLYQSSFPNFNYCVFQSLFLIFKHFSLELASEIGAAFIWQNSKIHI